MPLAGRRRDYQRGYAMVSVAIRPQVVMFYHGQLTAFLGTLTLVPTAVAAITGSLQTAAAYGTLAVLAGAWWWLSSRLGVAARLRRNETLAVIMTLLTGSALLLALPMMLYGISYMDALFEAVSAITTTGLSTLPTLADKPDAFLFARAWSQWLGGLTIVVIALALVFGSDASTRQLGYDAQEVDDVVGSTRAHARRVLAVYFALTVAGITLLAAVGMPLFDAVLYTFGALSTGGFAPHDDSAASLDTLAQLVLILICCAGATSFLTWYRPLFNWSSWRNRSPQLAGMLACAALAAAVLVFLADMSARDALFLAFSAQTTAGFAGVPPAEIGVAGMFVLVGCMFVGGSTGSTAGGVKVFRLLALAGLLIREIRIANTIRGARVPLRIAHLTLSSENLATVAAVVGAHLVLIAVSVLAFLLAGYPPVESLFEVTSAASTTGLSVGLSSSDLPGALKLLLCLNMLAGRVEVLGLLVLVGARIHFGALRESTATRTAGTGDG